jgi:chitodextrinase
MLRLKAIFHSSIWSLINYIKMNRIFLLILALLTLQVNITSAQIINNYLHGVKFHKNEGSNGPQLNLGQYPVDSGTFSFRESTNGSYTSFHSMTSWNSDPYHQFNLRNRTSNKDDFMQNFRLLPPQNYDENFEEGYPLIIMLHGAGERGNCWNSNCYFGGTNWKPNVNSPQAGPGVSSANLLNNDHSMLHGGKQHLDAVNRAGSKLPNDPTLGARDFPGFVLFPQNLNGWNGGEIDNVVRVIHNVLNKYNINRNRVVVHGLSNGAQHVVTLLKTDPALFAGVLLMSPSASNTKVRNSEEIAHIPMWVFQGGKDNNPTVSQTNSLVRFFEEMGGSARYYIYDNLGHGTWNAAYGEPDFFSWIRERDNSEIHVYYGDSTICASNGQGAKLGVPRGFRKYEWQRDGQTVVGLDSATAFADIPGTYRVRFSRFVENPTEADWNKWSKPVVIKESNVRTPIVTALNTTHLPDINGVDSVQLETPLASNLYYSWKKDGLLVGDTSFYAAKTAGTYTVETETFGGCPSIPSQNIYVTFNAPEDLSEPSNIQANFTSNGTVRIFWDDESLIEKGYEVYRSTEVAGFYHFMGLLDEDAISFEDTTVISGLEYFYKLRAVSNDRVSPYTSAVSILTGTDSEIPTTPNQLIVENFTLTSATLCWEASTDNEAIEQYYIYYGADSVATNSTATCFTVEGLQDGKNFTFTVKAIDKSGNLSMASNQVNVTTIFEGLSYEHSTGAYDSLDEIDWSFIEYTGTVPNFSLSERTQDDFFSFKFDGYINIENAGNYEFRSKSDDGSRVYIGGFDPANLVFDNDGLHGCNFGSDTPEVLNLSEGAYPITVTFFEKSGGQCLEVYYKYNSGNWTLIPDEMLKSGTIETHNPPSTPTNLAANANGMDQIDLSWDHTDLISDDLDIVVLGSSTAEGYGVDADSAWVGRLDYWLGENSTNYTLTNLAKGGYNTYHIRPTGSDNSASSNDEADPERNITKALSLNPDIILVNMPSNNIQQDIPIDTTMFHYRELKALADRAGVKTFFTTTQPRTQFGQTKSELLVEEADSVRSNFGNYVIDIFDSLADESLDIKSIFRLSGDAIHVNDLGHAYIFSEVKAKLLQFLTHFEIYRAPESGGNFNMIGRIENGFTSYEDLNLLPGQTYYYKIKAVNGNGSSVFTGEVNATTVLDTEAPSVPSNLEVVSTTFTNTGIRWTASTDNHKVEKYLVYADGNLLGESKNNTFYTNELEPEMTYVITVNAVDKSGNISSPSSGINVTSDTPIYFYAKSSGDLNNLSTWGSSTDGTGNAPDNFVNNGQVFNLRNRTASSTLSNQWQIDGKISKLVVEAGETLEISADLEGKIQVMDNAVVHVNTSNLPDFLPSEPNSHIYFNTYDYVPAGRLGNVTLNSTGIKNFSEGTLEILGDLEITSQIGLKGVPGNLSIILIHGNIAIQDELSEIALDNLLSVEFAGDKKHNLQTTSDILFYNINLSSNDTVDLQANNPVELSLGSGNGGGLILNDNSQLNIGGHTLKIVGNATINTDNSDGSIASNFGNISVNSNLNATSHLRFDNLMNKLNRLEFYSSANMQLHSQLELYDRIDLDAGTFYSNGNLVLRSNDNTTAQVLPMKNGAQLLGEVKAERFMEAAKLYRYISSPVSGVTVEDWQEFFPITGNFTGASTGSGLGSSPSLYYYDEDNGGWKEYPPTGTDNTYPINVGTGYAPYIRDSENAVLIENVGALHQGDFSYSLSGGTGSELDGWNLIGNPYAATIQWNNEGWVSSGIGNVVSVAKNMPGNESQFYIYDRSDNTGDLIAGEIASGQGFWVQSVNSSPSLTITEDAISTSETGSGAIFYRSVPDKDHFLKIVLKNPLNQEDATYIKFKESASDEYNKLEDGFKRPNSIINFYSKSTDGVNLAMNNMSIEFCELNIPLEMNNLSSGEFEMNFENIEQFPLAVVSLIDNLNEDTLALNQNQIISFNVDQEDVTSYQNRFILHLTRPEMEANENLVYDNAFCSGNLTSEIEIENTQYGVQYFITDRNGNQVTETVMATSESVQFSIDSSFMVSDTEPFYVKSQFPGCSVFDIGEKIQLQKIEVGTPELQKNFIVECEGSSIMLIANRQNETDEILWFNESINRPIENLGDTLHFYDLEDEFELISVQSKSAEGCLSDKSMAELYSEDFEKSFLIENKEVNWGNETEFCLGTASFTAIIPNSQEGIFYKAYHGENEISTQILGTGEELKIPININSLDTGFYDLKIVASKSGCEEITLNVTHTIELVELPKIELTGENNKVCEGEELNLALGNNNENIRYEWFSSGNLIEGESKSTIKIENFTDDLLPISVKAYNQLNCTNDETVEISIEVSSNPSINFEQDNYKVCVNQNLSIALTDVTEGEIFEWYSAGNLIEGETNSQITIDEISEDLLPLTVKAYNELGCSNNESIEVPIEIVEFKEVKFEQESFSVCEDQELVISINEVNDEDVFEWYSAGVLIENENSSQLKIEYFSSVLLPLAVKQINSFGCSSSDLKEVPVDIIETKPVVFNQENYSVCVGESLSISLEDNYDGHTIRWYSAGSLLEEENGTEVSIDGFDEGMLPIEVKVENSLGCAQNGVVEVPVQLTSLEIPVLNLDRDTIFILNPVSDAVINWYFNDELLFDFTNKVQIPLMESGLYSVVLESNSCSINSDVFEFVISSSIGRLDNRSVTIYPNPTDKYYLNIQSMALLGSEIKLQLVDMSGRLIVAEFVEKAEIENGYRLELPKRLNIGIYQLRMIDKDQIGVFKIILK